MVKILCQPKLYSLLASQHFLVGGSWGERALYELDFVSGSQIRVLLLLKLITSIVASKVAWLDLVGTNLMCYLIAIMFDRM